MSENKKQFNFKTLRSKVSVWDMVALAVFIALAAWYAYVVRLSIALPDESFYYTIPQRLLMGDKLFVDEWQVSQLSSLFQYIPYRLFVWLTGGKEGIILFMRCLSIFVAMALYWVTYIKLKTYHIFGIIIAFLLSIWFPGNLFHLTYNSLPVFLMMPVGLILFLNRKELSFAKLMLAGFLFAGAVLTQPFFVIIYFVFCALCLVRALKPQCLKNYDFVLNAKAWKGITLACLIAFVLVVGGIAVKSGIADVIKTVPELFTDAEFDMSAGGAHFQRVFGKVGEAFQAFGVLFVIGSLIFCVVSAFYRKKFFEKKGFKKVLLWAACLMFAAQIIHALVFSFLALQQSGLGAFRFFASYYSIPNALFGFSCYALCEKKNPRIFLFWVTSFLMSLICTYTSELYMSISGPISAVTPLLCLRELWKEHRENPLGATGGKKSKALPTRASAPQRRAVIRVVVVLGTSILVFWGSFQFFYLGTNPYVETLVNKFPANSLTETLDKGTHKGIKTTKEVKERYDNTLADLEVISANSNGQPFYVAGLWSDDYLNLDLPIGTYSTWYVEADSENRQLRYWELHPEKRPKYYYIPVSTFGFVYTEGVVYNTSAQEEMTKSKLQFIQGIADCNIEKGQAGYIVEIKKWK
ncbi:MAG: hypothetical protein IJI67_06880 [Clostridia bacterium]|nr:hypothetical protein [Clostridia bacterium]